MFFRIGINSSHLFPALFRKFDEEKFNLGIDSYGVSVTTLEEVFLKTGQNEEEKNEEKQINEAPAEDFEKINHENGSAINEIMKKSGEVENSNVFSDWFRHFFALFVKRYHALKRDISTLLCLILVPAVLMIVGVIAIRVISAQSNVSLTLDISQYSTPVPVPTAKAVPSSQFLNSLSNYYPSSALSVLWETQVFNSTSFNNQPKNIFEIGLSGENERFLLPRAVLSQEILSKSTAWVNPSYGGYVDVSNSGSFPIEFWIYLNQTGLHGKPKN
jgi:hypothetical protein